MELCRSLSVFLSACQRNKALNPFDTTPDFQLFQIPRPQKKTPLSRAPHLQVQNSDFKAFKLHLHPFQKSFLVFLNNLTFHRTEHLPFLSCQPVHTQGKVSQAQVNRQQALKNRINTNY